MKIRALIVDDEPLARKKLRVLLEMQTDVEVIGECANGRLAAERITQTSPDLVFLDIQMPGLDGFQALESVKGVSRPLLIFVTAHDKYALRAFEVYALDYLLKPFDRKRLQQSLERVRERIRASRAEQVDRCLNSLIDTLKGEQHQRLVIRNAGNLFFLRTTEIDWVEAADNYVRIHARDESYLLRETMSSLELKLAPRYFVRIHRSTIINIERLKQMRPLLHGDYEVTLTDGTRLMLSRHFSKNLARALGSSF